MPVVVEKAKIGKLKYIIGNGSNLMDFTYVGNVAHAHMLVRLRPAEIAGCLHCSPFDGELHVPTHRMANSMICWHVVPNPQGTYLGALPAMQAAKALLADASVAGQAYFITNDDARPFWTFLGDILAGLGYGPHLRPHTKLPYLLVFVMAAIFEYLVSALTEAAGASQSVHRLSLT